MLILLCASVVLLPWAPVWLLTGRLATWEKAYFHALYRLILTLAWLPANTAAVLDLLREVGGADAECVARAAVGRGLLRTPAPSAGVVPLITALRKRTDLFHHVTVLRADEATKAAIDVWPEAGSRASLLSAVKRSFDPSDTLDTGRGPL